MSCFDKEEEGIQEEAIAYAPMENLQLQYTTRSVVFPCVQSFKED